MDQQKKTGILMASIAGGMWAILAIVMKVANQFIDSYTISWFRFFFSFIFLTLILILQKKNRLFKILKAPPILSLVSSLFLLVNYVCYFNSVNFTNPSFGQVMIQLAPLFLVIMGMIFFKERITKVQIFGFLLSIVGFFIFYYDQLQIILTSELTAQFKHGAFLMIIAALGWASYGITQKSLLKKHSITELNLILYLFPTLILLPLVSFNVFFNLSWWQWMILIFVGFNTIIAYFAISKAFHYLPTNQVSMVVILNPLLTIFLMAILHLFGVTWIETHPLTVEGVIGAMTIVTGAIIVLSRKSNSKL